MNDIIVVIMDNIREIGENINNYEGFDGSVFYDELLSIHSSMRVGGRASVYIEPNNESSFLCAIQQALNNNVPYYILGGGSNLVFADEGFKGIIISTLAFNKIQLGEPVDEGKVVLTCGAGVKTSTLAEYAAEQGITGFTNFAGLPGTVGGACYMNARCYETDFSEAIESVTYLDLSELKNNSGKDAQGAIKVYHNKKEDWSYKASPFMNKDWVIIGVNVHGEKGVKTPDELEMLNEFKVQDRKSKGHFKAPSCGSVFKNNRSFGKPSGQIIDELGLKGAMVGGAKVSDWHANIIINTGNATAKDVKALVRYVQFEVEEKTGFCLEPEIIFVN